MWSTKQSEERDRAWLNQPFEVRRERSTIFPRFNVLVQKVIIIIVIVVSVIIFVVAVISAGARTDGRMEFLN
jgi:hypothetical protein